MDTPTHPIRDQILRHVGEATYRPLKPRQLARNLDAHGDEAYGSFRAALRELMQEGHVALGEAGAVVLPTATSNNNEIVGIYRGTKRGFGFISSRDPEQKEDLFVPEEGNEAGALNGDTVRAKILAKPSGTRGEGEGPVLARGRIVAILERSQTRFSGTLSRDKAGAWFVLPDGNVLTAPVGTPDAATRYLPAGTKVVVEVTRFPTAEDFTALGVIVEALGQLGEKDVDLKGVLVNYNLPERFPDNVSDAASKAQRSFDPEAERARRLDLTGEVIVTIDPDDAKDYDDAISLWQDDQGRDVLGVHIADVSHFVPVGSALDEEAHKRGNSCYFPGHVVPMLPEVLSNGVCSLQEAVPRFVKSAFITIDRDGKPAATRFANSIIQSRKRLRYVEAQAIIEGKDVIPHPEGDRTLGDYPDEVVDICRRMDALAKRMHARRQHDGQLNLSMPEMNLVLDEQGRVTDAVPADDSFTHTLIEMFMVEANEAVARLLDRVGVPFLRRIHPDPDPDSATRLGKFVTVAGHKLPKSPDRHDLQGLLRKVKGRPEEFAINMAVLRSLSRAEYGPESIGHFALASQHYTHFTSPIRRYCDLHIHRLLDALFAMAGTHEATSNELVRRAKAADDRWRDETPSEDDLKELGTHISYTERRAQDAERELRLVKILELMASHVGEDFPGVVTGITNFGLFIQLERWQVEGLVRYPDLLDDWWDVDTASGTVRGQRTGKRIHIGDVAKVRVTNVDVARRELGIAVLELRSRTDPVGVAPKKKDDDRGMTGQQKRTARSKSREKGKDHRRQSMR